MKENSTPTPSPSPKHPEQTANQHADGVNCPVCQMFIPVSISQLLNDGGVVCPHCGQTMTIDKFQSRQALEALKKLEGATKKLRDSESFKR